MCEQAEELFNSTFIKLGKDVNQLIFHPGDNLIKIIPQSLNFDDFKCFNGEPELENLMSNGN